MEDGVWRTVGGRRIFIKKGQNLSDAMKDSGKFNKATNKKKKNNFEDDPAYVEEITSELYGRPLLNVDEKDKEFAQKEYEKRIKEDEEFEQRLKKISQENEKSMDEDKRYNTNSEAKKTTSNVNNDLKTKDDAFRQAAKDLGYKRHTSDEKQSREIYDRAQEIIKENPQITEYENYKENAYKEAAKELGYKRHTSDEKQSREIYERAQEKINNYKQKEDWIRVAYNKYKQQHPKAKLTLDDFRRKQK